MIFLTHPEGLQYLRGVKSNHKGGRSPTPKVSKVTVKVEKIQTPKVLKTFGVSGENFGI